MGNVINNKKNMKIHFCHGSGKILGGKLKAFTINDLARKQYSQEKSRNIEMTGDGDSSQSREI